jgi:DNA-binding transcriptional LysR family regulator
VRYPGRGEPSGQSARGRVRHQALQSRTPAAHHYGSGQGLPQHLRDALDRIAVGTERLLQRQNAGVLKWLVHRLGHFAEAHPGIDLRVSTTLHHVDFAREEVDLAVRHSDGNWPGFDTVRLSAEQLFAVCSPKLLSGRRRLAKPADILEFPLLHLDSRADWTNWLEAVGLGRSRGCARSLTKPRKHGDRCGDQRPRRRARTHDAGGLRPRQRTAGATFSRIASPFEDLLDHLPEGHRYTAEDRDLPRLAT